MSHPFLKLEFRKGRFDEQHGMPLSVAACLPQLEEALREIARSVFFSSNIGRERVRSGFDEEFQLVLKTMTPGSSLAMIERAMPKTIDMFDPMGDEFDASPGRMLDALDALEREDDTFVSRSAYKAMDRFLKSLQGEEELTVVRIGEGTQPSRTLVVNHARAQKVALAATRPPKETIRPLFLVGRPYRINDDEKTMGLWVREQEAQRSIPITDEDMPFCLESFSLKKTALVRVVGEAVYGDEGELLRVVAGATLSRVGGPELTKRFDALRTMEPGWLGGDEKAPTKTLLKRAENDIWALVEQVGVDRPHVYPTPEAGVQAEWEIAGRAIQVEFRPASGGITYCAVATWNEHEYVELDETRRHEDLVSWLRAIIEPAQEGEQANV